jgi:hypothetical protein
MSKRKCQDCEAAPATREDPRDPPLDTGNRVLCEDCFAGCIDDEIAEAEEVVRDLKRRKGAPL